MSQETIEETQAEVPVVEEGEAEPNLESLMRDYEEWLSNQEQPPKVKFTYDSQEDLWEIDFEEQGGLVAYLSKIDPKFYAEEWALFLECELGPPDPQTDLSKLLRFSGDEPVLSRISLSEREEGEHVLVVESACLYSQIDFDLLDVMVREVLAISGDVRDLLGN